MLKKYLPSGLADLIDEGSRQQPNRELFYVFISGVVIMTLLALWAVFIRKPKKKSFGRVISSDSPAKIYRDPRNRTGRRRKRRRWKHRNPTLSETGGLPPARTSSDIPQF